MGVAEEPIEARIGENSVLNPELEWIYLKRMSSPRPPCSEVMIALLKGGVPVGRALTHSAKSLQKGMRSRSFNLTFF